MASSGLTDGDLCMLQIGSWATQDDQSDMKSTVIAARTKESTGPVVSQGERLVNAQGHEGARRGETIVSLTLASKRDSSDQQGAGLATSEIRSKGKNLRDLQSLEVLQHPLDRWLQENNVEDGTRNIASLLAAAPKRNTESHTTCRASLTVAPLSTEIADGMNSAVSQMDEASKSQSTVGAVTLECSTSTMEPPVIASRETALIGVGAYVSLHLSEQLRPSGWSL